MDNIDWVYIILIIIAVLFIIWLCAGGRVYDYVGVDPLIPAESVDRSYVRSIAPGSICSSSKFEQIMSHRQLSELQRITAERDALMHAEGPKLLQLCNAKPKNMSNGEFMAKTIIQKIYGVPFKKIRPEWLRNPETGHNLELDMYSDNIVIDGVRHSIALEYCGIQHYVYPNKFFKTETDFKNQVRRDIYKREICDINGVFLVTVPYYIDTASMQQYIVDMIPASMLPPKYAAMQRR